MNKSIRKYMSKIGKVGGGKPKNYSEDEKAKRRERLEAARAELKRKRRGAAARTTAAS